LNHLILIFVGFVHLLEIQLIHLSKNLTSAQEPRSGDWALV